MNSVWKGVVWFVATLVIVLLVAGILMLFR
jgi:hypothetical protein